MHGARALGLAGAAGVIAPGASADLLAVEAPEADPTRLTERLATGAFELQRLWLRGFEIDLTAAAQDSTAGGTPSAVRGGFR